MDNIDEPTKTQSPGPADFDSSWGSGAPVSTSTPEFEALRFCSAGGQSKARALKVEYINMQDATVVQAGTDVKL